ALLDIDMTGRASAGAAAFGFDPGHALLDRRLHDGRTDFAFDRASCALDVDKSDLDHVGRRSLEEKTRCRRGMAWTTPAGCRLLSAPAPRRKSLIGGTRQSPDTPMPDVPMQDI